MSNTNTYKSVMRAYDLLAEEEACKGQWVQIAALKEKMEKSALTVSIIGQFKRGKSTLANAILEDDALPVGIVPITSAVTKVVHGPKSAEVHFINGHIQPIEFARLSEFISEQENSNNELGVSKVVLHTPSKFLKDGLEFVDTPGVGSFHKNNTEVAYQYLKESDGVIFLLSVDSPINEIEIEFLRQTKDFAAKFYFAVNKTDIVSKDELDQYVSYCEKLLSKLMDTQDIKLFPVSAKTGEGIKALEKAILADRKKETEKILESSVALKIVDIIDSAVVQLRFYWAAMNMEYKELDKKFAQVDELIEGIKNKAEDYDEDLEIRLNEAKLELSKGVKALFGMEYIYEIKESWSKERNMTKEVFMDELNTMLEDLKTTLNSILLYREENAYKVVRRIANINLLVRRLREIQRILKEE